MTKQGGERSIADRLRNRKALDFARPAAKSATKSGAKKNRRPRKRKRAQTRTRRNVAAEPQTDAAEATEADEAKAQTNEATS